MIGENGRLCVQCKHEEVIHKMLYFIVYVHLFLLWYKCLRPKVSWVCCAAVFTVAELV